MNPKVIHAQRACEAAKARGEKPTRKMDAPLPSDWRGLRVHVERVEEMIDLARRFDKLSFEVECLPEEFVGHVAEVFRDRGHEVFRGRNRLRILLKGAGN